MMMMMMKPIQGQKLHHPHPPLRFRFHSRRSASSFSSVPPIPAELPFRRHPSQQISIHRHLFPQNCLFINTDFQH